jgi:23S rRNA G2069 N7-methylase RlmK/C1962 C5-methylase RlmI
MAKSETDSLKTAAQAEMFANRLRKRHRHLQKWARRIGTDVYRLYDRDIPEVPLVLDLYGGTTDGAAVSGALYRRPYEKDEKEEELWLAAMRQAAARALELPEENIFLKQRQRQRGESQYGKLAGSGILREVHEGGLAFRVNLSDYLDTGFFIDRRSMRALVRAEAKDKQVLNLFCYTGAFSLCTAAGGAASVDSVDLSNTYLDWAKDNFSLNKFDSPQYRFIRSDVLQYLDEAAKQRKQWDIIILDPPAFSNSKKMIGDLDLQRDHVDLIVRCLRLLSPGGRLWFSANMRHFKLDSGTLKNAAYKGAAFSDIEIQDQSPYMEDEDLKGKKIPLCFTFSNHPR